MASQDLFYVSVPLIIYLSFIIVYEIRTGLILDKFVFPAVIFFICFSYFLESNSVSSHILGMLLVLFIFFTLSFGYRMLKGKEGLGSGAIKLMASIGSALGLENAIIVSLLFIIIAIISLVFSNKIFNVTSIPSSPFALISVLILIVFYDDLHSNLFLF